MLKPDRISLMTRAILENSLEAQGSASHQLDLQQPRGRVVSRRGEVSVAKAPIQTQHKHEAPSPCLAGKGSSALVICAWLLQSAGTEE